MRNAQKWSRYGAWAHRNGGKIYLVGYGDCSVLQDEGPRIAIVGTRKPTAYGKGVCRDWGMEFAQEKVTLVTGAASGIDISATRVFHEQGAASIQVLPAPLDRVMELPERGYISQLLNDTTTLKTVVSQYLGEEDPATGRKTIPEIQKYMFVKRNATIALLADAVLVVEAAGVSGSFHTVWAAKELGVPVFAIPGRLDDKYSIGCNILIKNGEAQLATDPATIIGEIARRRASARLDSN